MSSEQALNYTATGGARAGLVNWSWPCARLEVTSSTLKLTLTFFCRIAEYSFRPDQVISITRYGSIPFFWSGIRITHSKPDYPATIVFWCMGRPDVALTRIAATGFHGTAPGLGESRTAAGFPFRWQFWVSALLIWNGLIARDVFRNNRIEPHFGLNFLAALAFAFAVCVAILRVPFAQRAALKPGRRVEDVRQLLILMAAITGVMLIAFTLLRMASR